MSNSITVKNVLTWGEPQNSVTYVAAASNRSLFAVGFDNGFLRILDPIETRTLHNIKAYSNPFTAMAFSPDDSQLITVSRDNMIKIWEVDSGRVLYTFSSQEMVSAVALSMNNQFAATGSMGQGNIVRIWDIVSGKSLHKMTGHEGFIIFLKFIESDQTLFSIAQDKSPRLWKVKSGTKDRVFKAHSEHVQNYAIDNSSTFQFLTGSEDHTLRFWLRQSAKPVTCKGLNNSVTSCAISPDGIFYVGGSSDGEICYWDACGEVKSRLNLFSGAVHSLQFSSNGSRLLATGQDGLVKVVDVSNGKTLITFKAGKSVGEAWWAINERRIVTFVPYGELAVWEIQSAIDKRTKKIVSLPENQFAGLYKLSLEQFNEKKYFSPDGRYAYQYDLTFNRRKNNRTDIFKIIRIKDKICLHEFNIITYMVPQSRYDHLKFFDDGEKFSLYFNYSHVEIWQIDPPKCLLTLEIDDSLRLKTAASHDGNLFAITTKHSIVVWSVETKKQFQKLDGNWFSVSAIVFSPDDTKIMVAGDLTISLWDLNSGKEVYRSEKLDIIPETLSITDDGFIVAKIRLGEQITIDPNEPIDEDYHIDKIKSVSLSRILKTPKLIGKIKTKRTYQTKIQREFDTLGEFKGAVFCPDEKSMLVCNNGILHVVSIKSNTEKYRFNKQVKEFDKAIFLPDGKSLLTIGDISAQLWDIEKRTRKFNFSCDNIGKIVSPDYSLFIGGDQFNCVVWNLKNGKKQLLFGTTKVYESDDYAPLIVDTALSPDGKLLLISDDVPEIQLFDIMRCERIGFFAPKKKDHWGLQPNVGFLGDGSMFYVHSKMETIEIFDTKTFLRRHVISFNLLGSEVSPSPDGSFIIVTGLSKIHIIDPVTGELIREHKIGLRHFSDCAISPDGKRIYYGKRDGSILLLDTETWEFTHKINGIGGEIHSISCSPDGTKIAARYFEGVDLIDTQLLQRISTLSFPVPLSYPQLKFNETWSLVALCEHQNIFIWKI
jgi:WD40 repeat protein